MMTIIKEWAARFDREEIAYALTGDLALSMLGYERPRPTLEFAVDPAAAARARVAAEDAGYVTVYASSHCSIHRSAAPPTVVLMYGETSSLPVPIDDHEIRVARQPARRFALSENDAAALAAIDVHLRDRAWLDWMETLAALRPHRLNTDADEPFTL